MKRPTEQGFDSIRFEFPSCKIEIMIILFDINKILNLLRILKERISKLQLHSKNVAFFMKYFYYEFLFLYFVKKSKNILKKREICYMIKNRTDERKI